MRRLLEVNTESNPFWFVYDTALRRFAILAQMPTELDSIREMAMTEDMGELTPERLQEMIDEKRVKEIPIVPVHLQVSDGL